MDNNQDLNNNQKPIPNSNPEPTQVNNAVDSPNLATATNTPSTDQVQAPVEPVPIQPDVPNTPIPPVVEQTPAPEAKKGKNKLPIIIIAIVVIVVAAIVAIVVINANKKPSPPVEKKEKTSDSSTTKKLPNAHSLYDVLKENNVKKEDLYLDFGDYHINLTNLKLSDFTKNGWTLKNVSYMGFVIQKGDIKDLSVYFSNPKSFEDKKLSKEELFAANLNSKIERINFDIAPKTPVRLLGLVTIDETVGKPTSDVDAAKILMKLCLKGFSESMGKDLEQIEKEGKENIHANLSTRFIVDNRYYLIEYTYGKFTVTLNDVTSEKSYNGEEWGDWFDIDDNYYNKYKDVVKTW